MGSQGTVDPFLHAFPDYIHPAFVFFTIIGLIMPDGRKKGVWKRISFVFFFFIEELIYL